MQRFILFCLFFWTSASAFALEESFVVTCEGEVLYEQGSHLEERVSPCSTFKIPLSLMGFDQGILIDQASPVWKFQEGYADFLESWRGAQSPLTWMQRSCVWYSQLLTPLMGERAIASYLADFDYGNQDFSGGIKQAWLSSSLKISPREQIAFLARMLSEDVSVSRHAIETTRSLLFLEELPSGALLYGKTGLGTHENLKLGWVVGWVEKAGKNSPFAYQIRDKVVAPEMRIQRAKELLEVSGV